MLRQLKGMLLTALLLGVAAAPVFAGGEKEGGKQVITMWMNQAPAMNEKYTELVKEYERLHPGIEFKLEIFDYDSYIQTLQTAFPSGTEGDVLMMFGTWVKSYSDRLAPVPDSLITAKQAEQMFLKAPLGGYLFDNELYGIPQEFNIEYGMLLVNKEIAAEAGLALTAGWKDWNSLTKDIKKTVVVVDGVMERAGLGFCTMDGIAYTFLSLLKQYGGSPMNADETAFSLETAAGKNALLHMKRLVDEGLVDPVLFNDQENFSGDAFFEEIMSSAIIGPWIIADYAEDYPDVVDKAMYVQLPSVGAAPEFIAASGWGLTVSRNSLNQDTSWDFIGFAALDEKNALEWNIGTATLPAIKRNTEKPAVEALLVKYPYLKGHVDILGYGTYQGHMPDSDLVLYDIFYNAILNMLQGNASVEDTLSLIQDQASNTLR